MDLLSCKKSAVCRLSFEGAPAPGGARLEWLMQPAALRRLARGPA